MVNRVVLIGRLTKDPELRRTSSGTSVCSFTLAVDRRVKTPGQPEADFINCVAWQKTADNMARFLHKGSLIAVEGHIQTRSYENQQGARVYVTEVVAESVQFLESRKSQQSGGYDQGGYGNPYPGNDQGYGAPASGYGNSPYGASKTRNTYQSAAAPTNNQTLSNANPYAASVDNDFSDAFADDSGMDIASDDLPF